MLVLVFFFLRCGKGGGFGGELFMVVFGGG